MNTECSHCNEDFKREIGFYYGAMYAAYGSSVFWGIGTATILVYFLGMPLASFFYFLIPSMIALSPWFYRISRLMWLNIFVTFDPKK